MSAEEIKSEVSSASFSLEAVQTRDRIDNKYDSSSAIDIFGAVIPEQQSAKEFGDFSFRLDSLSGSQMAFAAFFVLIAFVAAFVQLILVESDACSYEETGEPIDEQAGISFFVLSVIFVLSSILFAHMEIQSPMRHIKRDWQAMRERFKGSDWRQMKFKDGIAVIRRNWRRAVLWCCRFSAPALRVFLYFSAVRAFAFWYDSSIQCTPGEIARILKWVFGVWIVGDTALITMLSIIPAFRADWRIEPDSTYFLTAKYDAKMHKYSEQFHAIASSIVQIPAAMTQLILIWDPSHGCSAAPININVVECFFLLFFSYFRISGRTAWTLTDDEGDLVRLLRKMENVPYLAVVMMTLHSTAYWSTDTLATAGCESNYDQTTQRIMFKYIATAFPVWVAYDFVSDAVFSVAHGYGYYAKEDGEDGSKHKMLKRFFWFAFFDVFLLCILIPIAMLLLVAAWSMSEPGYLVFNAITIIVVSRMVLLVYNPEIITQLADGEDRSMFLAAYLAMLFVPLTVVFALLINSWMSLSPSSVYGLWYLLLFCIIFFSAFLCIALLVWVRGFDDYELKWLIPTSVMAFSLFFVQMAGCFAQLQLLQSDSCSTSLGIKVEAMALLILTALQTPTSLSSAFGFFGGSSYEEERMAIFLPACCVYATQLGLVAHLFVFWSENSAGCEQGAADLIVWLFTASMSLQGVCIGFICCVTALIFAS